jgi:hypothetical protein
MTYRSNGAELCSLCMLLHCTSRVKPHSHPFPRVSPVWWVCGLSPRHTPTHRQVSPTIWLMCAYPAVCLQTLINLKFSYPAIFGGSPAGAAGFSSPVGWWCGSRPGYCCRTLSHPPPQKLCVARWALADPRFHPHQHHLHHLGAGHGWRDQRGMTNGQQHPD